MPGARHSCLSCSWEEGLLQLLALDGKIGSQLPSLQLGFGCFGEGSSGPLLSSSMSVSGIRTAWGSEQWALLCLRFGADSRHRAEPSRGTWHPGCYCLRLDCRTEDLSFRACLPGPADYNEVLLLYLGSLSRPILWICRIWVQVEDGNATQPFPSRSCCRATAQGMVFLLPFSKHSN